MSKSSGLRKHSTSAYMGIDPTTTQEFRQYVDIMTKIDPEFTQLPQTLSCRCGFFFTNIYLTQSPIGFVSKPVSSLNTMVYAILTQHQYISFGLHVSDSTKSSSGQCELQRGTFSVYIHYGIQKCLRKIIIIIKIFKSFKINFKIFMIIMILCKYYGIPQCITH
jgi:hypothetical protein